MTEVKRNASNLQECMRKDAKVTVQSRIVIRDGRQFYAQLHGTKVYYYVDGERVTKQHQFDALCSAIALQEVADAKALEPASMETTAFASVRAPKDGVIVMDPAKRSPDYTAATVIAFGSKGTPLVGTFNTDRVRAYTGKSELAKLWHEMKRRRKYVGKARHKAIDHALTLTRERNRLKDKKQTATVVKRIAKLRKMIRILTNL